MSILRKIKESYAAMYESEIIKFNGDEYKTLSYLRVKAGGENGIVWYKKESIQDILNIGKNKLNSILNSLEQSGAIIIFNAKDAKTKRNCSNVYYMCEYDSIKKEYITANTIEEIKTYALEQREQKELEYAVKNSLTIRRLILEERPSITERKVKFDTSNRRKNITENIKKPCTENRDMEPCTENRDMEPCTENRDYINNKKQINNKKYINNNNNIDSVVVNEDDIKTVKDFIDTNLIDISKEDALIIATDLKSIESNIDLSILNKRVCVIKNYSGKINNIVGMLRTSIRERWDDKNYSCNDKSNFNNFDQRSYDYDKLEKKLLGWDK